MKLHSLFRKLYDTGEGYVLRIRNPALNDSFRIKSHLTTKERVTLYHLAKSSNSIVEIGSYVGASACCFGAGIKSSDSGRVYCIDTWKNDAMTEGNRDTWREFRDNTERYRKNIVTVRGFSTDVIDEVASRTQAIDLLFIDGDHSYEGVKADWEAYKKLLKPESVVVFHDWGWADGVKRVIDENVRPLISNHSSLPNMWWGTIGEDF